MITKNQLILLIGAVLAVLAAVYVLVRTRNINKQLENPGMLQSVEAEKESQQTTGSAPRSGEDSNVLSSDFDKMLSDSDLAELYEGEDYGFISQSE